LLKIECKGKASLARQVTSASAIKNCKRLRLEVFFKQLIKSWFKNFEAKQGLQSLKNACKLAYLMKFSEIFG
jgi:hypothetical protein